MLKIYRHRPILVEWSIFRSRGVLENFRTSTLYAWLCGESDRYKINVSCSNPLLLQMPEGLSVGDYSLVLMWAKKNFQTFIRNGKMLDDALCKTQLNGVFSLVDVGESPEVANRDTVHLRCSSLTEVYGYDGLDAYQIATIRGFNGSESEWLKSQRYVKELDREGDSITETMSQKATTDALNKLRQNVAELEEKLNQHNEISFEQDDDDNPLTDGGSGESADVEFVEDPNGNPVESEETQSIEYDYPDISDILNSN